MEKDLYELPKKNVIISFCINFKCYIMKELTFWGSDVSEGIGINITSESKG